MTTPNDEAQSPTDANARQPLAGAAAEASRVENNPDEIQPADEKPFRGWALLGFLVLVILFIAGVSALIDVIADVA